MSCVSFEMYMNCSSCMSGEGKVNFSGSWVSRSWLQLWRRRKNIIDSPARLGDDHLSAMLVEFGP